MTNLVIMTWLHISSASDVSCLSLPRILVNLALINGVVFAGKDASRALAKTSTKAEDVKPEWKDLDDKEKGTLDDWITYFSKRYNVVGRVEGATNTE